MCGLGRPTPPSSSMRCSTIWDRHHAWRPPTWAREPASRRASSPTAVCEWWQWSRDRKCAERPLHIRTCRGSVDVLKGCRFCPGPSISSSARSRFIGFIPRTHCRSSRASSRTADLQRLDLDGLIGRARSASYVPVDGPPAERLLSLLRSLHERVPGCKWPRHVVLRNRGVLLDQTLTGRARQDGHAQSPCG